MLNITTIIIIITSDHNNTNRLWHLCLNLNLKASKLI